MSTIESSEEMMPANPYYPEGLELPRYHPQVIGMWTILSGFVAAVTLLLAIGLFITRGRLAGQERAMAIWLLITGTIHIVLEGAFALYGNFFENDNPAMFLLEVWKLYGLADSRYVTADAFTVTMETFTAFVVGSLCMLSVYGLLARASWRWVTIFFLSTCQWYGTVLYFATYWFDGGDFTRPEPIYFWFFLVFMNVIWLILPAWCIWYSAVRCIENTLSTEKVKQG
jgi:cholestenol delta-isomerase